MANIKTFPEVIFITVEQDGSDPDAGYMNASLTKRDALNGEIERIVGTYKFVCSETVREAIPLAKKRKTRTTR